MALFQETFVQKINQLVWQRHRELALALGNTGLPDEPQPLSADAPLRQTLELLIRVANGEYIRSRASHATLDEIETTLKQFVELLFGNVLHTHIQIPDEFWSTDAGILVSRVRWWLSPDDLITISNAAALAFGENTQANRMKVARAMDKGLLEWIPDPSVSNPQQNRRVLRSQVERMAESNRIPE
jgi:hypothetical protein